MVVETWRSTASRLVDGDGLVVPVAVLPAQLVGLRVGGRLRRVGLGRLGSRLVVEAARGWRLAGRPDRLRVSVLDPAAERFAAQQSAAELTVAELASRIQAAYPGVEQIRRAPSG